MRAPLAACLLVALACQAAPTPSTSPGPDVVSPPRAAAVDPPRTATVDPPQEAPAPDWTDAGGGLSVRLELPPAPAKLGDSVELRLHFRNDGKAPLRIYLIGSEVFRANQSDLLVQGADGFVVGSQPEPHPHGYVVDERDFPEIAPGQTQVHSQTLHLTGPRFAAATRPLRLRWTYRNDIESWKGGAMTLDGPSKQLFGGGPIPGIWRGQVRVEASLPIAP